MVQLKYFGYREATIQKRGMTVGELRHRIANCYLRKPNHKIIILCLDNGERIELNSIEDALEFSWSDSCKIEIINIPHQFGVKDDLGQMEESAPLIFIVQMADEETNETVL